MQKSYTIPDTYFNIRFEKAVMNYYLH